MLKVWLPLNGDLRNQGLSDVTVTNNGATVNNSGKIGKCYSFNGSSNYITIPQGYIGDEWSYSLWAYTTSNSIPQTLFCCRTVMGLGFSVFLPADGKIRIDPGGSSTSQQHYTSYSYPVNIWFHFTVTYSNGKLKWYINGELKDEYTDSVSPTHWANILSIGASHVNGSGYTNFLNGRVNDIRIYDHCLSPKEVKEISKGLVLHYSLNRGGFGQDNLLKGSKDFSGTWVNGSSWTTSDEEYKGFTVKEKSSVWGGITQNIPCSNGDIFTISFYAKVESGGRICSVHRSSLGNVTTGLTILDGNFSSGTDWVNATDDATQWKKYWATVRIDSSDITYLQWRIENSISGKKLSICGMKIEEGSIATPWIPNSADALYSAMGLDDGIEYDVSGYQNNGTITGSLTCSSDTPRYMVSTYFNGGDNAITVPFNSVISDATIPFTINLWFKKSELGTDQFESLFGGPSGFEMDTRSGSATSLSLYMTSTRGGAMYSPFNLNEWYMVTMASDRTNEYYYVNGELAKTITAKSMPVGSYFIGAWQVYNKQNYKGLISDFRIYSTCLSADDILALYHTPVSIANNGVLMTQGEISEV